MNVCSPAPATKSSCFPQSEHRHLLALLGFFFLLFPATCQNVGHSFLLSRLFFFSLPRSTCLQEEKEKTLSLFMAAFNCSFVRFVGWNLHQKHVRNRLPKHVLCEGHDLCSFFFLCFAQCECDSAPWVVFNSPILRLPCAAPFSLYMFVFWILNFFWLFVAKKKTFYCYLVLFSKLCDSLHKVWQWCKVFQGDGVWQRTGDESLPSYFHLKKKKKEKAFQVVAGFHIPNK